MRQVFEGMDGAPEEEKYKEILKKQQAAHNASRRKTAFELDKDKKQLEVLQREIGKTLLGESLYSPEDLKEAISVVKARIADCFIHLCGNVICLPPALAKFVRLVVTAVLQHVF